MLAPDVWGDFDAGPDGPGTVVVRPASWCELSGIGTEPVPAGEFSLEVPPGVCLVEETGNPFTDAAAVMPGAAGSAVRAAADVIRRTSNAVSATRSFLDDLRGRSRN